MASPPTTASLGIGSTSEAPIGRRKSRTRLNKRGASVGNGIWNDTYETAREVPNASQNNEGSDKSSKFEGGNGGELGPLCLVCVSTPQDWAFGKCGHVVCGSCSHRMRVLYKDRTCVVCKAELSSVIVVPVELYTRGLEFDEVVKQYPQLVSDPATRMRFVSRSRLDFFRMLRQPRCPECKGDSAVFGNINQLRAHVSSQHKSLFCDTCLSHAKVYRCEMKLYPLDHYKRRSSILRKHIRTTHPMCQFCKEYFFDDDTLYEHLVQKHESCAICSRDGRQYEYYRNFAGLERHYQEEHFVCDDTACRGLVFGTTLDLQAHNLRVHGRNRSGSNEGGNRARITVDINELHNHTGGGDGHRRRRVQFQEEGLREFSAEHVVFAETGGAAILRSEDSGDANARGRRSTSARGGATDERGRQGVEGLNAGITRPTGQARYGGNAARGDYRERGYQDNVNSEAFTQLTIGSGTSTEQAGYRSFSPPDNDEEKIVRSRALMKLLRSQLDPASYELFKTASGDYRAGKISADRYYESVVDAFGVRNAESRVLPELIALLPNQRLRTELERETISRSRSRDSVPRTELPPAYAREGAFPSLPSNSSGGSTRRSQPTRVMQGVRAPTQEDFPSLVPSVPSPSREAGRSRARAPLAIPRRTPNMRQIFAAPAAPAASAAPAAPQEPVRPQGKLPSQFPSLQGGGTPSHQVRSGEFPVSSPNGGNWPLRSSAHEKPKKDRPTQTLVAPTSSPAFPPLTTWVTGAENGAPGKDEKAKASSLDLRQDLKEKRQKGVKNSLPQIGGSGYGFAWERRKLRAFKRQVRSTGNTAASSSSNSRLKYEDYLKDPHYRGSKTCESEALPDEGSGTEISTTSTVSNLNLDTSQQSGTREGMPSPGRFDEFSYLKPDERAADDVTASFFGS